MSRVFVLKNDAKYKAAIHDATVWRVASMDHLNTSVTFKSLMMKILKSHGNYTQKINNVHQLHFEVIMDYVLESKRFILVLHQFLIYH